MNGGMVPFCEGARRYQWHVASGIVYNAAGLVVTRNCHTLNQARKAVRAFQERNARRG